ncbi:hypothetical protein H0H92_006170 [Tricholoma furcatifolium]|nr:hypothetical protein H0H92_006170 [Tricholoma furcatifolium]
MSFVRLLQRQRPQICSLCRARGFAVSAISRQEAVKASPASPSSSTPLSSCTRDTVLTGVNYLKGQAPVVALADEEYPEWLWTVLQPKVYPDDGPGGKAERVKRRIENKQRIKDRNFMSTQ